jgi:hypothetical protein
MSATREAAIADLHPLPPGIGGVPEPIIEASDRLREAIERQRELEAEAQERREAVHAARRRDEQDADQAAREGKATPKPTSPKAHAEAEQAKRALDAGRRLTTEAREALADAIVANAEQWSELATAEVERRAADRQRALDEVAAAALAYSNARAVAQVPTDVLEGRLIGGVPTIMPRERPRLSRKEAEAIVALREALDG